MKEWNYFEGCQYLLHDRDMKFSASLRAIVESINVQSFKLPARSPNLDARAERWVKSVKEETLFKLILFDEFTWRHVLLKYYHREVI